MQSYKIMLLLAILALGCTGSSDRADYESTPPAFTDASSNIVGKSDGTYYGNSEPAKAMAKQYSESIKSLAEKAFTGGKKSIISLTGGDYLTHCELRENKVAFLVHVPQLKKFKGEVRDVLLELSWLVANQVVAENLDQTDVEIAIGLKGSFVYGGTAVGRYSEDPKYENSAFASKKVLYPFFEDPKPELEVEPKSEDAESEAEADAETEPALESE